MGTAFYSKKYLNYYYVFIGCHENILGPSSSWSYGSWIYNYLCNQCLSPLKLWVRAEKNSNCCILRHLSLFVSQCSLLEMFINVDNLNKPEISKYTYLSVHNGAIMLEAFMEVNKYISTVHVLIDPNLTYRVHKKHI
jgi:hypothetical protein